MAPNTCDGPGCTKPLDHAEYAIVSFPPSAGREDAWLCLDCIPRAFARWLRAVLA